MREKIEAFKINQPLLHHRDRVLLTISLNPRPLPDKGYLKSSAKSFFACCRVQEMSSTTNCEWAPLSLQSRLICLVKLYNSLNCATQLGSLEWKKPWVPREKTSAKQSKFFVEFFCFCSFFADFEGPWRWLKHCVTQLGWISPLGQIFRPLAIFGNNYSSIG